MWIKASMGQGLYVFCVLNFKYALYALMAWLLHQASKRSWQVRFAGHPKVLATGDLGL